MAITFGPILGLTMVYAIVRMRMEFRARTNRDWASIGILAVLIWLQLWTLAFLIFGPDMIGWFE